MTASLNLVRGRVTHMDLMKVMTAKETIYSFLSIGWGLFADIDIESEKMRSWGEARFMMRAFVRIAGDYSLSFFVYSFFFIRLYSFFNCNFSLFQD